MLRISSDKSELDVSLIHEFLSERSHWARHIPLATMQKSIDHSLCFGGFVGTAQVAFARVVSDHATFAFLGDVFVLPLHRGKGYSKQLIEAVLAHPGLQGLRRFSLATTDAHGLYSRFGFTPLQKPQIHMELHRPAIYAPALSGESNDS